MELRDYSTFSKWLLFTLLFVAVAIGGTIVKSDKAVENAKSPLKTMLIDDFSALMKKRAMTTILISIMMRYDLFMSIRLKVKRDFQM